VGRLSIRPIPLYKGTRDKSQWTYRINPGQKTGSAHYIWLIEGAEKTILVDCGAGAQAYRDRGLADERVQGLATGFRKVGLAIQDVELVILTHLHWDHVGLASEFPHASFLVQKQEYEFAIDPHPAAASGYDKDLFSNLNLELLQGDTEVISGVRLILTPGHTPGGQSVVVDTPKGLAVITGFCCLLENFFPPPPLRTKGIEIVAPGIHTDLLEAYDSVLKVKHSADIVIPLHDPGFLEVDRIPE
jgi:N-acyl homoserine lactone hydrolase